MRALESAFGKLLLRVKLWTPSARLCPPLFAGMGNYSSLFFEDLFGRYFGQFLGDFFGLFFKPFFWWFLNNLFGHLFGWLFVFWIIFWCFVELDTTFKFNSVSFRISLEVQSNLAIRNFSVTLKLFLNAKCSLSLWSKLAFGRKKWFLNTNLFLIKQFLIAKFDCTCHLVFWWQAVCL